MYFANKCHFPLQRLHYPHTSHPFGGRRVVGDDGALLLNGPEIEALAIEYAGGSGRKGTKPQKRGETASSSTTSGTRSQPVRGAFASSNKGAAGGSGEDPPDGGKGPHKKKVPEDKITEEEEEAGTVDEEATTESGSAHATEFVPIEPALEPPADPEPGPFWAPEFGILRTTWAVMSREERVEASNKSAAKVAMRAKKRADEREGVRQRLEQALDNKGTTDPAQRKKEVDEALEIYDKTELLREKREGRTHDEEELLSTQGRKERAARRREEALKKLAEEEAAEEEAALKRLEEARAAEVAREEKQAAAATAELERIRKEASSLLTDVQLTSGHTDPRSGKSARTTLENIYRGTTITEEDLGVGDMDQDEDDPLADVDDEEPPSPKRTRLEDLQLQAGDDDSDDDNGSGAADEPAATGSVPTNLLSATTKRMLKESQTECKRTADPMVRPVMRYVGE